MKALLLATALVQPLPLPPGGDPTPPGSRIVDAAKLGRPLVIYVGTPSVKMSGVTTLRDDEHGRPGIYIYFPDGKGWWRKDGVRYAVDVESDVIQAAVKGVSRQATPFVAPRIADDDLEAAGPWPDSVTKPKGLVRYVRAKYTQEIAVTNGRDRITPVHRLNLERKWHQSGGMEGVAGWRSDVYRLVTAEPYVANLPVWNGSNFQNNRGWTRSYPDGSRFDDVLSNTETGKVFEHRVAEKNKGKWTRRVVFSDPDQRPKGYTGLQVTCSSCHDQAGTGGYATGLVPGADTILSDPFPSLEERP